MGSSKLKVAKLKRLPVSLPGKGLDKGSFTNKVTPMIPIMICGGEHLLCISTIIIDANQPATAPMDNDLPPQISF